MGIESYINRIGGNSNVAEERFESLNIVNCNESLDNGDIIGGDGELNCRKIKHIGSRKMEV